MLRKAAQLKISPEQRASLPAIAGRSDPPPAADAASPVPPANPTAPATSRRNDDDLRLLDHLVRRRANSGAQRQGLARFRPQGDGASHGNGREQNATHQGAAVDRVHLAISSDRNERAGEASAIGVEWAMNGFEVDFRRSTQTHCRQRQRKALKPTAPLSGRPVWSAGGNAN